MTKRPTMQDVADLAGVGPATVDRVLNERGNVSEDVRRVVINAARELGLRRKLPPSYKPIIRVNLIIARPNLPLLERMTQEFRAIVRTLDRSFSLQVTTLPKEDPDSVAKALHETTGNAVIIYAQDHPKINAAVQNLAERNVAVVTIISDLPDAGRLAYAGTDHLAAGRTAAFFVHRMTPKSAPIVLVCNQLAFRSHADRIAGFREYFGQIGEAERIANIIEGFDERARTQGRLEGIFRQNPEISVVYNVGAANLGVRAAIEADILAVRPMFIGHELTVHTAQMLRDGIMTLTIDQNPRLQAQFAIDLLMDFFGYEGSPVSPPYVSDVPIVLYTAENIPPGA